MATWISDDHPFRVEIRRRHWWEPWTWQLWVDNESPSGPRLRFTTLCDSGQRWKRRAAEWDAKMRLHIAVEDWKGLGCPR